MKVCKFEIDCWLLLLFLCEFYFILCMFCIFVCINFVYFLCQEIWLFYVHFFSLSFYSSKLFNFTDVWFLLCIGQPTIPISYVFTHPTPLFWYLGFHGNAILNFINTPKAFTHYGEYSYDVSWSLMKEIKKKLKFPLYLFPWQLRQRLISFY